MIFDGPQPLGGNDPSCVSAGPGEPLEMNGIAWSSPADGNTVEICAVDALFPGELPRVLKCAETTTIVTASHTHTAPMLDREKPHLGQFSSEAVAQWAKAYGSATREATTATQCDVYRADVGVPIYRRFDRPDTILNRALTRWARMYPNDEQPIDRGLYLALLRTPEASCAVIAIHACHPVTRADTARVTADYVAAIRTAVRERWGSLPCVFLQGASGDVRPNIARKRVKWLPMRRLNWRFEYRIPLEVQHRVDASYCDAVHAATLVTTVPLEHAAAFDLCDLSLLLRDYGAIPFHRLRIGGRLTIDFVPFEVSHRFQCDARLNDPLHFIVGCAQETRGYLPHPSQLSAGGYEVDDSRRFMGLPHRVEIDGLSPW